MLREGGESFFNYLWGCAVAESREEGIAFLVRAINTLNVGESAPFIDLLINYYYTRDPFGLPCPLWIRLIQENRSDVIQSLKGYSRYLRDT